jgi:hypothetical protein
MSRIIIGIHGLGNKPPKKILENWWYLALLEGLGQISHPEVFFNFELIYWADILHAVPLDPEETDHSSPYYIAEPYVAAVQNSIRHPSNFRRKLLDFLEKEFDRLSKQNGISRPLNSFSNLIIRHYFKDLDQYYSGKVIDKEQGDIEAKTAIRNQLISILKKYQNQEILLIAHSMGSIVAYEVLSLINDFEGIDTLVTIGSPLGQPFVINKFKNESEYLTAEEDNPKTPEAIRKKWYNFTDLEDKIAINYDLADDYSENSKGIQVVDKEVYNNYAFEDKPNPHKLFGYLRTAEIAEVVYQFLSEDQSRLEFWLKNKFHKLRKKFFRKI